jgi:hypothetical protein
MDLEARYRRNRSVIPRGGFDRLAQKRVVQHTTIAAITSSSRTADKTPKSAICASSRDSGGRQISRPISVVHFPMSGVSPADALRVWQSCDGEHRPAGRTL